VVLALAVVLAATAARAERLPLRIFTSADGLATDRVGAIVRDSHGFLWFGTGGGLSRFDGRTFQTFGPAEGLTNQFVNDLVEERPGRYWVATNGGGLFLFRPRERGEPPDAPRFVRISVGTTLASDRVNVIACDAAHRLWIGTDDGLFLMESTDAPDRIRRVTPEGVALGQPLVQVWALRPAGKETMWIGTSVGLFALFPNGRAAHSAIRPLQGADHAFALLEQADGTVLVGHEAGLFRARLDDASARPALQVRQVWKPAGAAALPGVRGLLRFTDGSIWFTGNAGVGKLEGESFRIVVDRREIDGETRAIAHDTVGNIWAARLAGGVARITHAGVSEFDARDGLGVAPYGRIFEARTGELCVIGRRDINVFDGQAFTRVTPRLTADALGAGRTYGMAHEDRLGEWWIPAGDRLYRFSSVTRLSQLTAAVPKAVYTTRDGLAGVDIVKMFEDSRGDLWLSVRIPGRDVVTRWDRASETFHRYGEADGLRAYNAVSSFAEDRSGSVWLGFLEGGLARYRAGKFEWLPGFDRLGGSVGPLHVDRQGRLWIGTFRDVRRIDNPSAAPSDLRAIVPPGLEHVRPGGFVEDPQGRLFLNADVGLIRWNIEDDRPMLMPARGRAGRQNSPAMFADRHGALWFAATPGVTRVLPPSTAAAASVTMRIGFVRVNGRPLATDDLGQTDVPSLALAAEERRIEIGYFALGSIGENDVAFQYRLEGSASDWSDPSPAGSVNFPQLAPGTYRFEVRPVGSDGAPLGNTATVSFHIPPPLWARWWFLSIAAVVLVAAGVLVHRRRVARAVELERIRTSIASDLHDDIGSNLSQISLLTEILRSKSLDADSRAVATVASISDLSRESVDAMSDIVWAIDPQKDHLTSLTSRMRRFASELLAARDIRFQMRLDGIEDIEIGADVRRHMYLVFKEALNNVVRHSSATRVDIQLQLTGGDLVLTVRDDGRGFDPTAASDGHGLRSLSARAKKAGGTFEIHSQPGHGTTVVLRVRVRHTHLIG
jgi:signal transduction histidine kinase/ligand-binding sensor domain-containing protein